MNKLNFGCGSIQPYGWINIDNDPMFYTGKTTKIYDDNHFDIIVAHAVVQQFEWHEMVVKLKELYRVLKVGGVLRISLPDIEEGFSAYLMKDADWFPNGEEDIDEKFSAWLTWYSTSKTLLTKPALCMKLAEAGFKEIATADFGESVYIEGSSDLDTREKEFYFIEAKK